MDQRTQRLAPGVPAEEDYLRFRASFLEHEREADQIELLPDALERLSKAFWDFGAERKSGETKLRLRLDASGPRAFSVLEIVTDDRPFLVASVLAELGAFELALGWVGHPIVAVERDGAGRRVRLVATRAEMSGLAEKVPGVVRESMIQVAFERAIDPSDAAFIETRLRTVLNDVAAVVADWKPILAALDQSIGELEAAADATEQAEEASEALAFLNWLKDNHFIFMGLRDYSRVESADGADVEAEDQSGLGVLRDASARILRRDGQSAAVTPAVAAFLEGPSPIIITKANFRSTVQRRVYMDYVGVKRYGPGGKVIGERRFLGLFTSAAYNSVPHDIPILRRKIRLVLARASFSPTSYNYNVLANILETYPRDELFQIDENDLFEIATGIMRLSERPRTRLFVRRDKFDRYVSALVYMPREHYTSELRETVGNILKTAYHGRVSAFYPHLGDGALVRVHFIIGRNNDREANVDVGEVEARIVEATRNWRDLLHDALAAERGEDGAQKAQRHFGEAFSVAYRAQFSAEEAVADIAHIEKLGAFPDVGIMAYRRAGDPETALRIKLYRRGEPITLSKSLPILEHMGLAVASEFSYTVSPRDAASVNGNVHLHDFLLAHPRGLALDLEALAPLIESAFPAIWLGAAGDDGFNRLIIEARMPWREVAILRALARYLLQTGSSLSQPYMEETLAANAGIAHKLLELFRTRLDPARKGDLAACAAAAKAVEADILKSLEEVQSLDQDRILRRFLNLVAAILRTNYYQRSEAGAPRETLAFKLDSRKVEGLPEPVPLYEISVYSPRVEAVHLRFARVARGGIRWSDRREDFRTEVLGLVKAQFVKNAVIVPSGAKGGFVPQRLTPDMIREEIAAEGIACYTLFIEALLELTDNLSVENPAAAPIRLAQTLCYDDADPYLVVAADKGTATFSDTANAIAQAHGFWLGDAFASGGSNGYDHKTMGITARGAWEAVKRHFRELGTDIQIEPFKVVGVGDMSGDVFGNGMLLSRQIRLIAAFDHRDIFIDPAPDLEASFNERKRLFDLPRSSWQDYDKKLISQGGGVFSRKLKSIPLSDEMRAALDVTAQAMAPSDLIRAILCAKVDLLWFGGIGTYVKAEAERNSDVGDSTNDALRVDGGSVRAKVIGEGANLGCTQRGRVAYALAGGKINTDAIDNSAGVDCSDHEVNIKILLDSAVAQGALQEEARNRLLKAMTEDVATHVLLDNYNQTLALTLAESTSKQDVDAHARFIRVLEREGRLKRDVERLPAEDEIADRKVAGIGLTRPEIAVLLAYCKIKTYEELLESGVPDEAALQGDLIGYFPPVLAKEYPAQLRAHRLKREIIATALSNEMTNIGGLTYVNRMRELGGADTAAVARAYAAICAIYDILDRRADINALDNRIAVRAQTEMHVVLRGFLRRQTMWFLARRDLQNDSIAAMIARYRAPVAMLRDQLMELCSPYVKASIERARQHYLDEKVPGKTAHAMSLLEPLLAAGDIADLAIAHRVPIEAAARAHAQIGEAVGFERLLAAALRLTSPDHWERLAIRRITEDLTDQQRVLSGAALVGGAQDATGWLKANAAAVKRVNSAFDELEAAGGLTAARLALAVGHLRDLAAVAMRQ